MSETRLQKETREHDFTHSKWGWSIAKVYDDDTAIGHGLGILSGDTILLRMASGRVGRWRVQEIDYYLDPRDMFKVKIQPLGYKED